MYKQTSPFDIAEDVVTVELPELNYDKKTQTRYNRFDPVAGTTWNATQTFSSSGQPRDSDND